MRKFSADPTAGKKPASPWRLLLKNLAILGLVLFVYASPGTVSAEQPIGPNFNPANPTGSQGGDPDAPGIGEKAVSASERQAYITAVTTLDAFMGSFAFTIGSAIDMGLFMTAAIMDAAIDFLVIKMGSYDGIWQVVQLGWTVVRDLGNTVFVFAILYAAFNTVLGLANGARDLLPRIIIVALLFNFSYTFSVTVIDASNSLAATSYAQLKLTEKNLSLRFIKAAQIESLLTNTAGQNVMAAITNNLIAGALGAGWNLSADTLKSIFGDGGTAVQRMQGHVRNIFTWIFKVILGLTFLTIAFTFVTRFVMLVMLTTISSAAFLAYMFPQSQAQTSKWWALLVGQALYAPTVFILLILVLAIQSEVSSLVAGTGGINFGSGRFGDATAAMAAGIASEALKFIILIAFLIGAMRFSKMLADRGGKLAVAMGQRAQRAAGSLVMGGGAMAMRSSVGRLGAWAGKSDRLNSMASSGGIRGVMGKSLLGVANKAQSSSFDVRATGAGRLLADQSAMDFGKAGGKGGFKAAASAKEKEIEKRIKEAKSRDISAKDKQDKISEIAKEDPNSKIGRAQTVFSDRKIKLDNAVKELEKAKAGGVATAIASAQMKLDKAKADEQQAKEFYDKVGHQELNKRLFGVNSSDKAMNYSVALAQSMKRDAMRMGSIKSVGAAAAGGIGLMMGGPAAAAVGLMALMGSGKLVSSAVRSFGLKTPIGGFLPRRANGGGKPDLGSYVTRDGSQKPVSFWQAMGANQSIIGVSDKMLKSFEKLAKTRNDLDQIKAEIKKIEDTNGRITEDMKDRKKKLEKDIEEQEKKLKVEDKKEKDDKKDGGKKDGGDGH